MSKKVWSNVDPLSMVVIALTLVLFVVALFVTGFTHDLLQECGVFLVSVKLIMMSHRTASRPDRRTSGWRISRICCKLGENRAPDRADFIPRIFTCTLSSPLRDGCYTFYLPQFEERMAWPRKPKSVTP